MATYHNTRCALCGQYQVTEDRELLLEDERFEWDESLVDDFIAGNRHLCVDTDPYGARESARLADAGFVVPELRWLLEAALERCQAAGRPAWAVFTGSAASITTVAKRLGAMACRRLTGGSPRPAEGRARVRLPADWPSRSPPWRPCPVPSCTATTTLVAEPPASTDDITR